MYTKELLGKIELVVVERALAIAIAISKSLKFKFELIL